MSKGERLQGREASSRIAASAARRAPPNGQGCWPLRLLAWGRSLSWAASPRGLLWAVKGILFPVAASLVVLLSLLPVIPFQIGLAIPAGLFAVAVVMGNGAAARRQCSRPSSTLQKWFHTKFLGIDPEKSRHGNGRRATISRLIPSRGHRLVRSVRACDRKWNDVTRYR